jgi:hypothetical protein
MILKKRMQHNGTFIFSFSIINSNNFNMGREVMRIPINSTFTKEISKQFKRIFDKDTTLNELQNLQEIDLINPVDSYLENQVAQIRKANEPKKNVSGSRAVRQEYTQGKSVTGKTVQIETEKKGVGI